MALTCGLSIRAQDEVSPDTQAGANLNIGERLFLETRFSQYFFTNCGGNVNADIPGDPTVATVRTIAGRSAGPFAGMAMNCRQCHLVDEKGYGPFGDGRLGNRTYADFARRSPVPSRDDGRTITTRNSQALVDALLPRDGPLFLHHDGQFATARDLIISTLTGRNYGWKPEEYSTAVEHIARVIREDDGAGYLATEARDGRFGVLGSHLTSYRNVLGGFSDYAGGYVYDIRSLLPHMVSPQFRLDMRVATDAEIMNELADLIEFYLRNLTFSQETNGVDFFGFGTPIFNGSPFDVFLIKNNLPRRPDGNEPFKQYARRLLTLVTSLTNPQLVTDPDDGSFSTHAQTFEFGTNELEGLKIFLTDQEYGAQHNLTRIGNCATCHSLPAFTDFIFHNTGVAQAEYDGIFGAGSFSNLFIPELPQRETNYDAWLPATRFHHQATGIFESPASALRPGQVDLGLWNVYANPDFPGPQPGLQTILPQMLGLAAPHLENPRMAGRQFSFNAVAGQPGGTFVVLATTNLALNPPTWATVATNTFDAAGNFTFTNSVTDFPDRAFYRLSVALPSRAEALPGMVARFKTPSIRDLTHSAPYFHNGSKDSFEAVVQFYMDFAQKSRTGLVRNADTEMANIRLDPESIAPLAAFLRALNEDYTD